MEYDKINNLLLSEDNESEKLSKFVTKEYVRVNIYLIRITKINQLDLKHHVKVKFMRLFSCLYIS